MDNVTTVAGDITAHAKGQAVVMQDHMAAILQCSQIWAEGCQAIGKDMAATAQARMAANMATLKSMSGVTSLKDAMELQTSLTRTSVENAMADIGKLTEAWRKLAEQTMAPLTARLALAAENLPVPTL